MFTKQAQAVQRSQDTSPGDVLQPHSRRLIMILTAVLILLNLLRKNVYPQAFKNIYTFTVFGAAFALDHNRLCAHVQP